ncbi:MAG: DNA helicase RecQ [Planctomycetota bacterium]
MMSSDLRRQIAEVAKRYWGFDALRPLQAEAIQAACERRDSLVVLPTGGGKSLCYQVPPVVLGRTDVVVSPLVSLMKDQVDALLACGYPAAALHSGMSADARREVESGLAAKRYALVFAAPERLVTPGFLRLLDQGNVQAFAIDEAHCISHWGHDFRPEYRELAVLKERFPQAAVHAYTATATARVRADIVEQLRLTNPTVLVGRFDRPNLVYRVIPRVDEQQQVREILGRHKGEAAIVYCISRKDTEALADFLQEHHIKAQPYHAGLAPDLRRRTQDAFAEERIDVVVATVAFGMGIDRSNVRCVIHAASPKSIEHYQQETGRAGRDGLEAECALLYSAADVMRWESLIRRSAEEAEQPEEVIAAAQQLLEQMRGYCSRLECRHRLLSEHFEQPYDKADCGACDVCLNEVEGVADATETARKILSCVARVQQRFGATHVVDVLLAAKTESVFARGHDKLSTYGLMKGTPRKALTNMVFQLVDQGLLIRTGDDHPTLRLNDNSWAVLRGQRPVRLIKPKAEPVAATGIEKDAWASVDRGLFEHLRGVRRELAQERSVPAFVIFSDATLRELARIRPTTESQMRRVRGVGERKLAELGERFLAEIAHYHREHPPSGTSALDAGARRR